MKRTHETLAISDQTIYLEEFTVVPFWRLGAVKRAEIDEIFTDYSRTEEAKAAPVVPLERGDINNYDKRPFGATALTNDGEQPASHLSATSPVWHEERFYAEAGSMMTLPEYRGHRLGQFTLASVSAQLTGEGITPISSANENSERNYWRENFREAELEEIPPSVTEFCVTECPKRELLACGQICCDKIVLLDKHWEETEEGLYVPENFGTDETASEA